jgi:hypothetical protein
MVCRGFCWLHLQFVVHVATLGVGFPTSCPMASRGSSSLNMACFVGVATFVVGLSASCLVAFLGSAAQWWHLVSAFQCLSGLSSWVRMCHVVCQPKGHISLNIIENIIPNPKIFTETRTQDSFRVCGLSSCNILSETNKFCLGTVLLLCLVLELHKTSSSGLERRTDFGVVAFVSIIFFSTHNCCLGALILPCLAF